MKPPKFHVGQAVVCLIGPQEWTPVEGTAPAKGQICTVEGNYLDEVGDWCLELEEFQAYADGRRDVFWERYFAPVEPISDEALAELLEEVFTPVHA